MTDALPRLGAINRPFWQSGETGVIQMQLCTACGRWRHPPGVRCADCGSRDLQWSPVTGRGTVVSHTVNHQPWAPDTIVPYTLVLVELDEQAGLRLTSRLVDGPMPNGALIGSRVSVVFERREDVWLPLFQIEDAA